MIRILSCLFKYTHTMTKQIIHNAMIVEWLKFGKVRKNEFDYYSACMGVLMMGCPRLKVYYCIKKNKILKLLDIDFKKYFYSFLSAKSLIMLWSRLSHNIVYWQQWAKALKNKCAWIQSIRNVNMLSKNTMKKCKRQKIKNSSWLLIMIFF